MKQKRSHRRLLVPRGILTVVIGSLAFFLQSSVSPRTDRAEDVQTVFRAEIIALKDGTFGYDIFADGKRIIHQPHMPAVHGLQGFATVDDARRVAQFVIGKLAANEIPSVSKEELDNLKIMYY